MILRTLTGRTPYGRLPAQYENPIGADLAERFEGPLGDLTRKDDRIGDWIGGRGGLYTVFGDPGVTYDRHGRVRVSSKWERANLIVARRLPLIGKLYVHRLVEPYLREALRRAVLLAPEWMPARAGAFCPRHQRHNSGLPLSDHTWAAAIDFADPDGVFHTTNSTMPRAFFESFESVGFEWGGRWKSYPDQMHFQIRRTA